MSCNTSDLPTRYKHIESEDYAIEFSIASDLPSGVTVTSGSVECVYASSGVVADLIVGSATVGDDDNSIIVEFAGGTAGEFIKEYRWETEYVLNVSFVLSSGGDPVVRQCLLTTYNHTEV